MRKGVVLAAALALVGCASAPGRNVDPWESWNRKVYSFNEALDESVLKPVATTYTEVVPQPVRTGVDNFFGNFADAWSAVNNLLQGKLADSLSDVMRVGTNTFFGLFGLLDIASEAGIDRHREDFGQTLGRWGFEPGIYIVWPLLGPSTVRDSFALPLDLAASPSLLVDETAGKAALFTLQTVNTRANLLGASRMLDDIALDKYTFVRDAYLQRRRSLVYDGDVPEDEMSDPDEDDSSEPAEPPASAASGAQR